MRRDHSMLARPPAPRSWCHNRAPSSACSADVSSQPPRSRVVPRSLASLHACHRRKARQHVIGWPETKLLNHQHVCNCVAAA